MAITLIKKTCLAGRRVTVQIISLCTGIRVALTSFFLAVAEALPPVRQKNLLKLAFRAPKFRRSGDFNTPEFHSYMLNNQWYMRYALGVNSWFSSFETKATDFEFNTPILKNRAPILKNFEGF